MELVDNCITCNAEFTWSEDDVARVQCFECWSSDVDYLWPTPRMSGETKFFICMMIAVVIAVVTLL